MTITWLLAGPHPLPAILVHTSLSEKCFFPWGDHISSSCIHTFIPALNSFPGYFSPGPGKNQSDYGLDQWLWQETSIGDETPSGLAANDCSFRSERSPTLAEGAGI